ALVLGASRAIGETVVILVAAGNNPNLDFDLTIAHQNMAAFIANTARSDVAAGSIAYATIFAVGLTLFVMTFALNSIAIRFVRRYRQVYE
ncbi:MAG: phosphate ABC transporter permease subunit PstC, partial [Gemmatimonadetes bacterium]|nr:phosphate ABC transporter permease subunit PstC [Gemmatimonadota bacterium]